MSGRRLSILLTATLCLTGCSSAPTQRQLVNDAIAAMGGTEKLQAVQTLIMKGDGSRWRLGQAAKRGDSEQPAKLSNVVETIDLANSRAAHDYEIQLGNFMQHRREVITKRGEGADARPVGIQTVGTTTIMMSVPGLFSWSVHNSPEALLRRNVVSILTAAAESAPDSEPAVDREFEGRMLKYAGAKTKAGETVGLYFDPESKLLQGFEVTDTETMLGDVPAQYILSDYKPAAGLTLPHKVTIRKKEAPYSEIQYSSIAVNDAAAADVFRIPDNLSAEADLAAAGDYVPMKLTKVADRVYQAQSFRHHTLVVEFPSYVAIVEAPYTEIQSHARARHRIAIPRQADSIRRSHTSPLRPHRRRPRHRRAWRDDSCGEAA